MESIGGCNNIVTSCNVDKQFRDCVHFTPTSVQPVNRLEEVSFHFTTTLKVLLQRYQDLPIHSKNDNLENSACMLYYKHLPH